MAKNARNAGRSNSLDGIATGHETARSCQNCGAIEERMEVPSER